MIYTLPLPIADPLRRLKEHRIGDPTVRVDVRSGDIKIERAQLTNLLADVPTSRSLADFIRVCVEARRINRVVPPERLSGEYGIYKVTADGFAIPSDMQDEACRLFGLSWREVDGLAPALQIEQTSLWYMHFVTLRIEAGRALTWRDRPRLF